MSYILDALKKAEAERQVGGVPSIHAAGPGNAAAAEEASFLRKFLPWIIIGLLVLIMLAYLLWSQPWNHNQAVPAAVVPAPPPAPAIVSEPAPVTLPTAQPAAQPAAQAIAPAPAPATPLPPALAPVEKPAHPAATPIVAEKPKAEEAKPAASAAAAASAASATVTAPQEEEVGTMQDLPPNIQRELPPVSVNGYIYARNPADRSALINKKLLHEGENIAPDLVLEKLTPKGAVLNFKGYRYRISF